MAAAAAKGVRAEGTGADAGAGLGLKAACPAAAARAAAAVRASAAARAAAQLTPSSRPGQPTKGPSSSSEDELSQAPGRQATVGGGGPERTALIIAARMAEGRPLLNGTQVGLDGSGRPPAWRERVCRARSAAIVPPTAATLADAPGVGTAAFFLAAATSRSPLRALARFCLSPPRAFFFLFWAAAEKEESSLADPSSSSSEDASDADPSSSSSSELLLG